MGVDLGTRLQEAGLLTRESLERLLSALERSNRSFVDALLAADEVDEAALVGFFLAEGHGPLVEDAALRSGRLTPPPLAREMCEALAALPFSDGGSSAEIAVAMADPTDAHALGELERALGQPVRPHVVRASTLEEAITYAFTAPDAPAVASLPAPQRVGTPSPDEPGPAPASVERRGGAPDVVELVNRRSAEPPPAGAAFGLEGLKVATRPIPLVHPTERRSAEPGHLADEEDVVEGHETPIELTRPKLPTPVPEPTPDEEPIALTRPSRSSIAQRAPSSAAPPRPSPPAESALRLRPASPTLRTAPATPPPPRAPAPPPAARELELRKMKSTLVGNPSSDAVAPAPPARRALKATLVGNPSDSDVPPRPAQASAARLPTSAPAPSEPPPPDLSPTEPFPRVTTRTYAVPVAASPVAADPPAPRPAPPAPKPAPVAPPSPAELDPPRAAPRSEGSEPPAAAGEQWGLPPAGPRRTRDQLARPSVEPAQVDLRRTDPDLFQRAQSADLGSLLATMRGSRDREGVVVAALEALMTTVRRGIFLVVKRDVLQGWDGRGPMLSTDALRNLWIPVSSPSMFRDVVEAGAVYRGQPGATTADAIFLTAVSGRPAEVILQPIIVRGRVVAVLYGEDPAYGRAASERAEVIARACCDAFERIILDGR